MLSDDELTGLLHDAYRSAVSGLVVPAGLAGHARRDLAVRRRRVVAASAVGPLVLAAAVFVGVLGHSGASSSPAAGPVSRAATGAAATTTPANGSIELDGYVLALPAHYSRAVPDTNCTGELHLSAGQRRRLISSPEPGCPFLLDAVVKHLPAKTTLVSVAVRGASPLRLYNATDPATGVVTTYLPARLPAGEVVYVSLSPAQHTFNIQQVIQLAAGLRVLPAPKPSCAHDCG